MWLPPTSHLSTGGLLYPCVWPSVSTPATAVRSMGAVDRPKDSALKCMSDPGQEIDMSWTVPVLEHGVLEIY